MSSHDDVQRVANAARKLDLRPRGNRWCHLSLCVLDTVFSIGARYSSTRATVERYAARGGLTPVLAPAVNVARGDHADVEEPLPNFLERVGHMSPDEFADYVGNRQLTSTRGGIRKAEAAQEYARVLRDHGIDRLGDVTLLMRDLDRTAQVEKALAAVPGHGSGVRVSYLWMLAGDDTHVKADRVVMRWVGKAVQRRVGVAEATHLTLAAAAEVGVTPWMLDHAIWQHQRAT